MTCWALKLQEYDYEIYYMPEKENGASDTLSFVVTLALNIQHSHSIRNNGYANYLLVW